MLFDEYIEYFKIQYAKNSDKTKHLNEHEVIIRVTSSLQPLLELHPDIFTMELIFSKYEESDIIYECNVFYVFKKDDVDLLIQHCLENTTDEMDEIVISGFIENEQMPGFGGKLKNGLYKIKNYLHLNKVK